MRKKVVNSPVNRAWSDQNKQMQSLLKKATFAEGIRELISLRDTLMQEMLSWKSRQKADFCAIPYLNAEGYHSKTVAYSLWHIFRIEDIVVNILIRQNEQILFAGNFAQKMHAPILTTGNELQGLEIARFSEALDIEMLYQYIQAVKQSTDDWLRTLDCGDLKRRFSDADKARLEASGTVSPHEHAAWLMDYWCGKDVRGLLQMPLSRHWIMHTEAAIRILNKQTGTHRNGV